jgi:hypothetical protein
MTEKLQDFFNLPVDREDIGSTTVSIPESSIQSKDTLSNMQRINEALPTVKGLDVSDAELDELSSLAQSSYKDLMELGMNVEARHSSEIFQSASSMLGHAITAKQAKINKKLKMIDMQLKKARLDQTSQSDTGNIVDGMVIDRNELLERLLTTSTTEAVDGEVIDD